MRLGQAACRRTAGTAEADQVAAPRQAADGTEGGWITLRLSDGEGRNYERTDSNKVSE